MANCCVDELLKVSVVFDLLHQNLLRNVLNLNHGLLLTIFLIVFYLDLKVLIALISLLFGAICTKIRFDALFSDFDIRFAIGSCICLRIQVVKGNILFRFLWDLNVISLNNFENSAWDQILLFGLLWIFNEII